MSARLGAAAGATRVTVASSLHGTVKDVKDWRTAHGSLNLAFVSPGAAASLD